MDGHSIDSDTPAGSIRDPHPTVNDGYKRAFDLTIVAVAGLALLPLLLLTGIVVSIAIWLEDRGPVFYMQERVGWRGKPFRIIKFRTMSLNSDQQRKTTERTDLRVTKVGKVLRWLYLDELPQLANVVRGDMSLVGPRPEWRVIFEQQNRYLPGYSWRLLVRPGITGLAQVRGDHWTCMRHKLRYDKLYVQTMNPWLDLKLLALTPFVIFASHGQETARKRRDRT